MYFLEKGLRCMVLNEFIIPNIQRHEPLSRELGVQFLGLCCLLDQVSKISNKYWR